MFAFKDEATRATLYIYGTIGADFWDEDDSNRAKDFAKTLDELSPKPLDIRIDSAGGDVYEGFAIASAIQRYEGETHVYIDGMAASAASYIALMADYVTMNDYAVLMIHNAWTVTAGNRHELLDMAARLESLDATIAGVIAARSALTLEEVREAMDAETWYTADDALAAGMVNEVIETEQRIAASIDRSMAAHFLNIPETVQIADEQPKTELVQYEMVINGGGITLRPVGSATDENNEAPDEQPLATFAEPMEDAASHAVSSIQDNEEKVAEGAYLLGNHVYWKE